MKRLSLHLLLSGMALALLVMGCNNKGLIQSTPPQVKSQAFSPSVEQVASAVPDSDLIPGQYIVVFKDQNRWKITEQAAQQALQSTQSVLTKYQISVDSVLFRYKYALKGFAAKLSQKQINELRADPLVDHVSRAYFLHLGVNGQSYKNGKSTDSSNVLASSSQVTPWGVSRVGGPFNGTGKKAWIIDSGIDLTNPDLNVDQANSVSFISGESANDTYGHGTYVAGLLAAKNNSSGVVGVASGATVIALKACYSSGPNAGSCPSTSVINALDYVSTKLHIRML